MIEIDATEEPHNAWFSLSVIAEDFECSRETARKKLTRSGARPDAERRWRARDIFIAFYGERLSSEDLARLLALRAMDVVAGNLRDLESSVRGLRIGAKGRSERDRIADELQQLAGAVDFSVEDEVDPGGDPTDHAEPERRVIPFPKSPEPVATPMVPAAPRQTDTTRVDAMALATLELLAARITEEVPADRRGELMGLLERTVDAVGPPLQRLAGIIERAADAARRRTIPAELRDSEQQRVIALFDDLRRFSPRQAKDYLTTKISKQLGLPRGRVKGYLRHKK